MRYFLWTCIFHIFLLTLLAPALAKADELSDLKKRVEGLESETQRLRHDMKKPEHGDMGDTASDSGKASAHFGIFTDVDFATYNREKAKSSFYLGDVDIHGGAKYGSRLTAVIETIIQNQDNGFVVDVARLWVGYTWSDLLVLRAGKHHTAIGYWNKTYHHGAQLYQTVDRPFFLAFEYEDGVIPVHITGVELEGNWSHAFARLKYEFDVGNNPRFDRATMKLAPNSVSDTRNSKMASLRVSARPTAVRDLSIGASAMTFTIDTTRSNDIGERIYGVDLLYGYHGLELLTEYFILENKLSTAEAYYVQLAYSLAEDITPYARYETLNPDGNGVDPYLGSLSGGFGRSQTIAGVKYDIDVVRSSLKAQYRYDSTHGGKKYDVFETQWSFGF